MSTFRGFPHSLISRVKRAGSHYLDTNALRFFNAYGGAILRQDRDTVALVESVRFEDEPREYRVVVFSFAQDGSGVEVNRPTENYPSAAQAIRAYRELVTTK